MNEIKYASGCSGIGGFELGFQRAGGFKRVWSCDWDYNEKGKKTGYYANKIYRRHFKPKKGTHITSDIRRVDPEKLPDFDLFCAGFPCQAFSVAGERRGFEDTRGTVFFEICRIAETKQPPLLLLENVKGLLNHDQGRTFTIILQSLDELGYWIEWQVLNSKYFGVPQHRERVFIIGHLRKRSGREIFPITEKSRGIIKTQEKTGNRGARIWNEHHSISRCLRVEGSGIEENLIAVPVLTPLRTEKRQHGRRFKEAGDPMFTLTRQDEHGVLLHRGYSRLEGKPRIYNQLAPTITTPSGGGHIPEVIENSRIRKLTEIEAERLMGFPDNWTAGFSYRARLECLGNAVVPQIIEFLGRKIRSSLSKARNNGIS